MLAVLLTMLRVKLCAELLPLHVPNSVPFAILILPHCYYCWLGTVGDSLPLYVPHSSPFAILILPLRYCHLVVGEPHTIHYTVLAVFLNSDVGEERKPKLF